MRARKTDRSVLHCMEGSLLRAHAEPPVRSPIANAIRLAHIGGARLQPGFRISYAGELAITGTFAQQPNRSHFRSQYHLRTVSKAIASAIASAPYLVSQGANLPQGAQITHGQGSVEVIGNTMVIAQGSHRMAVDWTGFDIAPGYTVRFQQPSAQSSVLNTIQSYSPTVIRGSLIANGQVTLVNPSGITFTRDAQVNVGSLIASTLPVQKDAFMEGRLVLEGDSTAALINEGSLTAHGGDGTGGHVALVAARIINEGSIRADQGQIALVAASRVALNFGASFDVEVDRGVLQAQIDQGGAILAPNGQVLLTAKGASDLMATAINQTGHIAAQSLTEDAQGRIVLAIPEGGVLSLSGSLDVSSENGRGGTVEATADRIHLGETSRIDATGDTGGGTVRIGGDWQGSGTLRHAQEVHMDRGAAIDASAQSSGDGGTVVLWSSLTQEGANTVAHGRIHARGGSVAGDGGQIETSGKTTDFQGAEISASAAQGNAGLWLIDPDNLTVGGAGLTAIANSLNAGTSVSLDTTGACPSAYGTCVAFTGSLGDIIMRGANINLNPTNNVTFSINAGGSVTLGGAITATGNALSLDINPGNDKAIIFRDASTISTNGGSVNLNGPVQIWNDLTINTAGGNLQFGGTVESLRLDTYIDPAVTSTWTAPAGVTQVEVLVVAGGGGGGYDAGGGGGGGGVEYNTAFAVTPGSGYSITVGAGGGGGSGYSDPGTNTIGFSGTSGGASSFGTLSAAGGGGGGGRRVAGTVGGNTGTGGVASLTGTGGLTYLSGTPLGDGGSGHRLYAQGTGASLHDTDAGYGGGGAGGPGGAPTRIVSGVSNGSGGNGGVGVANDITGITQIYGSGGGGGSWSPGSTKGLGGVGAADGGTANSSAPAVAAPDPLTASASYGGGGGGGGNVGAGHGPGTAGASGIVAVKYQFPNNLTLNTGTGSLSFAGTVGNVGAISNLTISSLTGSTSIGGGLVRTTGTQSYGNPITITSPARFEATGITATNTINAAANSLELITDSVALNGNVSGSGALTIRPLSISRTIGINTGVGDLHLDASELARLSGFSSISIGRTDGTGAINVNGSSTIGSSTVLRSNNGAVNISGPLSITGSFTAQTSGTTTLAGGTLTTTGSQTFVGPMSLGANLSLTGTSVSSQSTITGGGNSLSISGNANILGTVSGLSDLTISGTSTIGADITSSGNQNYLGLVTLNGANRAFNAGSGITLQNGAASATAVNLTLTATSGGVSSSGNLVLAGGNITIEQGGNSTISGAISSNGGALAKRGAGTLLLSGENTFSGGISLSAGTLGLRSQGALSTAGAISFDGGTLQFSSDNTTDYSARFSNAANQQYRIDTNGQPVTLATPLTSTGGTLTKTGAGTLTLLGTHTFTGLTTISAGALSLGNGLTAGLIQAGTTSATVSTILNNAELIVNNASTQNLYARVNGTGSLTKNGSGLLILDPGGWCLAACGYDQSGSTPSTTRLTSTFSGNITINGGVLRPVNQMNVNPSPSSSLGNPGIARTITINDGGTLEFGQNDIFGNTGFLPLVDIVVNRGGVFTNANPYGGDGQGVFNVLGNVTVNGGTWTSVGGFNNDWRSWYLKGSLTSGGVAMSTVSGASASSGIHLASTALITAADSAVGDDLLISTDLRNLPSAGGAVALTKSGAGTVVLSGSNSFSGNTNITAGVLVLGDGGSSGSLTSTTVNLSNNAALHFNRSDNFTFIGTTSGAGSITQRGTGTTTLTGSSSYTGGTNLLAGTLNLGSATAIGGVATAGTVSFSGGTLQFSAANTLDYSSRFSTQPDQQYRLDTNAQSVTLASNLTSVGGSLTKLGAGTLTVTGANSFSGGTSLEGGVLALQSADALGASGNIRFGGGVLQHSVANSVDYSGRFSTEANQHFRIDTNSRSPVYASGISSMGGQLTKLGAGTLTLSGINTYTGNTTVSAGTLQIGLNGTTGSIAGNLINSGNVTFQRSNPHAYAGDISGTGSVRVEGAGVLTLSGSNSYTGSTTLAGGTLALGSPTATGNGGVIAFTSGGFLRHTALPGGTADLSARFSTDASQPVGIDTNGQDVTYSTGLTSSGGQLYKDGLGTLRLTGNNTYTGQTFVWGGVLQIGNNSSTGSLTGTSSVALSANTRLSLSRNDAFTFDRTISGTGGLRIAGDGVATISGTNAYTGPTEINAGVLALGSSAATGNNGTITFGGGTLRHTTSGGSSAQQDLSSRFSSAAGQHFRVEVITGTPGITYASDISSVNGQFTKTGAGDLTFTGTHTYTGPLTINAGQVWIGEDGTSGFVDTDIVNNGLLTFYRSDDVAYAHTISGTGIVQKFGTGSLTLSGNNTFSGTLFVDTGTVRAAHSNALGSTAGFTEVLAGATLELATGIDVAAERIVLGNGSGGGTLRSSTNDNSLQGDIVLFSADSRIEVAAGAGLTLHGEVRSDNGESVIASGGGALHLHAVGQTPGSEVGAISLTGLSDVSFNGAVTSTDNIAVQATNSITINGNFTVSGTGDTVTLDTAGIVTQAAGTRINASRLALLGSTGNYALSSAQNTVDTFAAVGNNITFVNNGALTVGTVNPTGVVATGPIFIETTTGDLTISQPIQTTDSSDTAITLIAASSQPALTAAGGDIILSGAPSIATGTGGRARFFTGSIAGSTAIAAEVGAGSARFRYGASLADQSRFTTPLGNGKYLVYREQPSVTVTASDATKIYDGAVLTNPIVTCAGCVNGDNVIPIGLSGAGLTVTAAGSYTLTPDMSPLTGLGYAATEIDGTLTIHAKPLSLIGLTTGVTKVYDGTTTIAPGTTTYQPLAGVVAGDDVSVTGQAVFGGAAAGNQALTQGTIGLSGDSAGNYALTWSDGLGLITPAPLTVTARNDGKLVGELDAAGYQGVSYSGFVAGETAANLSGVLSVNRTNSGVEATGSYPGVLVASGLASSNYDITFVAGDYQIVGADRLLVTFVDTSTQYGTAPTLTVDNARYLSSVNNTILTLGAPTVTNGVYRFDDGSGGIARFTVGVDTPSYSTANALRVGNYTFAPDQILETSINFNNQIALAGTLTVTPKPITAVTGIVADSKEYDGNTTASANLAAAAFTGKLAGDLLSASNTSATFDTRNVGDGKTVTVSGLALSGADAANYVLTNTTSTTLADITRRTLTPSDVVAHDKTYDRNTLASIDLSGATFDRLIAGDAVVLVSQPGATASFSSSQAGTNKTVSVTGLGLSGSDAANYALASESLSLQADINPKGITLASVDAANKVYDTDRLATVTLNTATFQGVVAGDSVTLASASGLFDTKNVGTSKPVTVSAMALGGDQAANYTLQTAQFITAADITQASVAVTGAQAVSRTYDGTSVATITGASVTPLGADVLSLSSATASFSDANAGLAKPVAATFSLGGVDAGNYVLVQPSGLTADITPAPLTITGLSISTKVYDGTTSAAVSGGTFSGLIGSDAVTINTGTAAFIDKNVGVGKAVDVSSIQITGLGGTIAANYQAALPAGVTGTITALPISLSGQTGINKTYDGTTAMPLGSSPVQSLSGILAGDSVSVAGSPVYNLADAGARQILQGTVSLQGDDAGNYQLNWTNGSGTIAKAPLQVQVNNDAKFVTLADTSGYAGANITGFVAGETASVLGGSLTIARSNAGTEAVGRYTDVLTGSGLSAANYTLQYTAGDFEIVPANQLLVRTVASQSTYGSTPSYTLQSAQYLDTNNGVIASLTLPAGASQSFSLSDNVGGSVQFNLAPDSPALSGAGELRVGSYQLGASSIAGNSANFSNTLTIVGSLVVNPLDITVSVSGAEKTYDRTTSMPSLSLSPTGVLSGDTVAMSGVGAFIQSDVSRDAGNLVVSDVGYTIQNILLSGADAANYQIASGSTFSAANGRINPKPITQVTEIRGRNKVYDGLTNASVDTSTALLSGALAGDALTLNASTAVFDSATVGTGKTITASGLTLSGASAHNYTLIPNTSTTTADITLQLLTLTGLSVADKVYDGLRTASLTTTGASLQGLSGSDLVQPDYSLAQALFNTRDVGSLKPVTVSGITLSGPQAANYTLVQPSGLTGRITTRPLTINGLSGQNKSYDGSSQATLSTAAAVFAPNGVVSGDQVSLGSYTAQFASSNAAIGKAITVSQYTLTGADANNYSVSLPTGLIADILPRAIDVTNVATVTKTYDGLITATLDNTAARLNGVLAADAAQVSLVSAAAQGTYASADAGNSIAVTASGYSLAGTAASNYSLIQPQGLTGAITPLTVSVTGALALNKTYDGTTLADLDLSAVGVPGFLPIDNGRVALNTSAARGTFASAAVGTSIPVSVTDITLTGAAAGNYLLTQPAGLTADILSRNIFILQLPVADKTYDQTTTASPTVGGLVLSNIILGHDVSISFTGSAFQSAAAGINKPVDITGISLTGANASSYILQSGTHVSYASILPKTITANGIAALSRPYDNTSIAAPLDLSAASITGVLAGDTVSLDTANLTGRFATRTVGANKPVTLVGLGLTGEDAANYQVQPITNLTASITPLTITGISGLRSAKVYDGSIHAPLDLSSAVFSGALPGDQIQIASATANFASKQIGLNKPVSVSNIVLGGREGQNYVLASTSASSEGSISARPITLIGASGISKVYDQSMALPVDEIGYSASGTVAGDQISIDGAPRFSSSQAGDRLVVRGTLGLSGLDSSNYQLVWTNGRGTITPRPLLSVTGAVAVDKRFDGNNIASADIAGATVTGVLPGDSLQISAASGTFNNAAVGDDKPVLINQFTLFGSSARNYFVPEEIALLSQASITGLPDPHRADNTRINLPAPVTGTPTRINPRLETGVRFVPVNENLQPTDAFSSIATPSSNIAPLPDSSAVPQPQPIGSSPLQVRPLPPASDGSNSIDAIAPVQDEVAVSETKEPESATPSRTIRVADDLSASGPLRILVIDGGLRLPSFPRYPSDADKLDR